MQILSPEGETTAPWFIESAMVIPDPPEAVRLSGIIMRNHLYFATAPGNTTLSMPKKKNGIVSKLPVV
jgi:hypothetical protein